jgi:hypothetical protein
MSEEHSSWGVFFTNDADETYLVAARDSEDAAIERAGELDEGKMLERNLEDDLPNLHRVEPISEELAAEVADQLAEGEPVLVRAP